MRELIKQGLKFVGISGLGWLLDFTIYTILNYLLNINVDIINMISSLIGVTFVFIFSTRKVFKDNGRINIKIKYLIYVVYQVILILLASKTILLLRNVILENDIVLFGDYLNIVLKIFITPFTLAINFVAMKYLIEKI